MSGWDYYWDKGVLVRLPGGFWTGGAKMYSRSSREWLEYGFRADLEGRPDVEHPEAAGATCWPRCPRGRATTAPPPGSR